MRRPPVLDLQAEHRTLAERMGTEAAAQLLRHTLYAECLRRRGRTPTCAIDAELAERLRGCGVTPEMLDHLPLLSIDARATGSYYTCPDVANYLARATLLPLLFDGLDEAVTANADLEALCLERCAPERSTVLARLERLTVVDPTCGTGAFLLAALRLLRQVRRACLGHTEGEAEALGRALHGLDVEPAAVEVCRMRLALELLPADESILNVRVGDALGAALEGQTFDAVLGNPPYVRHRPSEARRGYHTASCGDLSALVVERAYQVTRPGGRLGLLLPISHFVTEGFAPLQRLTLEALDRLWVAFFANRPSQLFPGAQKRLAILLGRRGGGQTRIHTTAYQRWRRQDRPRLLARLRYTPTTGFRVLPTSLEKVGSPLESGLLDRLLGRGGLNSAVVPNSAYPVFYTRKFGYFLGFLDAAPTLRERRTGRVQPPSEMKTLCLRSQASRLATVAALSSSTFFWFWNAISDGRNVNRRDLLVFPFNPEELPATLRQRLADLGHEYLARLRATSRLMRKGPLDIETFDHAAQKGLLDEIDGVLAEWYGLDDRELAFVRGYHLEFRMPRAL